MSAALFIFDTTIDITNCLQQLQKNHIRILKIFPLTSNFFTQQALLTALNAHGIQVQLLPSADLINQAIEKLESNIHQWSANLANLSIAGKSLAEWFALPKSHDSSWWFTLLAEKNSVQHDCFFQVAQINAIENYLQHEHAGMVLMGVENATLRPILKNLLKNRLLTIRFQPRAAINLKERLRRLATANNIFSIAAYGLLHFALWWRDARCARSILPPLDTRIPAQQDFLFVSYFPNLDQTALANGRFINRYGHALQQKLAALQVPITWLLMPVYYDGLHFPAAMQLAKKLAKQKEKLCVLQEFYGFKELLKSLRLYLKQAIKGIYLWSRLDKKLLLQSIATPAALPIFKYMWWHSFLGASSARGILFYLNFQVAIAHLSPIKNCLYYCEMQAWEKALLIAMQKNNPAAETLAFQHTVVMRNYFNYFYDRCDTAYPMPAPSKILVNGLAAKKQLLPYFEKNLVEVEAIRHLYLSQPLLAVTRDIDLIVIGSYDYRETLNLITMVIAAIANADQLSVWIKGSPVNPIEPILKSLNIDAKSLAMHISNDNLSLTLPRARMAIVANTTVVIEAAACGCEVIIPLFADIMMMNPIIETDANYHIVTSPQALSQLLQTKRDRQASFDLDQYWHLDENLPRWSALLQNVVGHESARTA